MDLINGFGRASPGFGLDKPTGSGRVQGSLHKVFFPICSTLFSKRFILLNSGLKVLKFYEKLIIRSANVLIVL